MTAAALSASRRSCSLGSTPPPAGVVGATAAVRAGRAPPPPSWLTPSARAEGFASERSIGSLSPTDSPPLPGSPLVAAGRTRRCPVPDKLAPEPCSGASFLARIERRCARQIGSGHPVRRTSAPCPSSVMPLLSCLVTHVHSTGAGILRPPGGAIFPGTGQQVGPSQKILG